jgi:hypothetical protein
MFLPGYSMDFPGHPQVALCLNSQAIFLGLEVFTIGIGGLYC